MTPRNPWPGGATPTATQASRHGFTGDSVPKFCEIVIWEVLSEASGVPRPPSISAQDVGIAAPRAGKEVGQVKGGDWGTCRTGDA